MAGSWLREKMQSISALLLCDLASLPDMEVSTAALVSRLNHRTLASERGSRTPVYKTKYDSEAPIQFSLSKQKLRVIRN